MRVATQVSRRGAWPIFRKSGRAAEMFNRAPAPKGTVQLPKSMAGKFGDVTGTSLPGITASITNVERGHSNPLYEFFKSGVALWGRQHQRAVDAAWREALTNPDMARVMSSALKLKQPTPMPLSKITRHLRRGCLPPRTFSIVAVASPSRTRAASVSDANL